MASSDRDGLNPLYPGLAVVLLAAIGALFTQFASLEPSRPTDSEIKGANPVRLQNVVARLWQDPIDALERAGGKMSENEPLTQIVEKVGKGRKQLDILTVLISGAPYPGSSEARRRSRYAVVSALHASGYIPKDSQHIGVAVDNNESDAGSRLYIPFEEYRPEKDPQSRVLVLWVDVDALGRWPLGRLQRIFLPIMDSPACGLEKTFKFIGPESSTTLKRMLNEIQSASACVSMMKANACRGVAESTCHIRVNCHEWLSEKGSTGENQGILEPYRKFFDKVEFYSATATASDNFLLNKAPGDRETISAFLTKNLSLDTEAKFYRMIPTDDMLARALPHELELRGLDFKDKSHKAHIVLLSEWDTAYGRALPVSIYRAFDPSSTGQHPDWIHPFSYPHGLDGMTAPKEPRDRSGNEKKGDDAPSNGSKAKSKDTRPLSEPAEGDGQFDYLRRLSIKIQYLQNALQREGKEIQAVGVFGTDVYDKLLILKALRPSFPGAVFFTTDLDARLLHANESRFARNLVVLSGFGFQLSEKYQRDILPFRSSYQTATYLAALSALDRPDGRLKELARETINRECLRPRTFEIGRTTAVDLSLEEDDLHPRKPLLSSKPWSCYFFGILMMFLVASLTIPHIQRFLWHRFADDEKRINTLIFVGIVLAAVLIPLFTRIIPELDREEPFVLLEGVSIWPAQIIRGFALILAVACLHRAKNSLWSSENRLTDKFFANGPDAPGNGNDQGTGYLARFKDIFIYDLSSEHLDSARELWLGYRHQSQWRIRVWRVTFASLSFLGLSLFLMYLFGFPYAPVRGGIASGINTTVLTLLILAFIFLLFFVVDAIRLCKHLADQFVSHTIWPAATANRERSGLGLKTPVPNDPAKGDPTVDSWLDIKFFAEFSRPVADLIYYPFLILALIIAARSTFFDNWETPAGLVIVFIISFGFAMYCAVALRLAAEKIRRFNLGVLCNLFIAAKGDEQSRAAADQLELLIRRIEGIHDGAFAPFSQQPVFRALIMPLSAGSLGLLEYLSSFF